MTNNLYNRSIEVILENQSPIGAYIASPNFETYHFSWIRDGSYIAYSMNLAQKHESAANFHNWVAKVVLDRSKIVDTLTKVNALDLINEGCYLHTRFTMDGKETEEDWPNFQLDGFGTWLWSLAEHIKITKKPLNQQLRLAIQVVSKYLLTLWQTPCYDLWEEHPSSIHPYTLACIYGGLRSIESLIDESFSLQTEKIKAYILNHHKYNGYISKFMDDPQVDASLIGLCIPYNLFSHNDAVMQKTIFQIEQQLNNNGGVKRYSNDSYFGGGEWILLSAWLGWYYCQANEIAKARELQQWIEEQAIRQHNLPEQVPNNLRYPEKFNYWEKRWGKIANPLLWSHAKYIILKNNLDKMDR